MAGSLSRSGWELQAGRDGGRSFASKLSANGNLAEDAFFGAARERKEHKEKIGVNRWEFVSQFQPSPACISIVGGSSQSPLCFALNCGQTSEGPGDCGGEFLSPDSGIANTKKGGPLLEEKHPFFQAICQKSGAILRFNGYNSNK